MKKFLVAILLSLFFTSVVLADKMDEINNYPIEEHCNFITALYAHGITFRNNNQPLVFKQASSESIGKTDAIYVVHFNELSERDRAYAIKHISNGWNYADVFFQEALRQSLTQIAVDVELAKDYRNTCFQERVKQSEVGGKHSNFLKTQSRFLDPKEARHEECKAYSKIGHDVVVKKQKGYTMAKFYLENPIPEDAQLELAQVVHRIVTGAFEWTGSPTEYEQKIYVACMVKHNNDEEETPQIDGCGRLHEEQTIKD